MSGIMNATPLHLTSAFHNILTAKIFNALNITVESKEVEVKSETHYDISTD